MFQRILVPLDGSTRSEQAIPVAAMIARASDATLVLLRVANVPREYGLYLFESYIAQTPIFINEVRREEIDKARNYLDILHQMQDLDDLQVENLVLNGAEAPTILDAARDQQADLMVMSGHGSGEFRHGTLGSVAMKVVRHSACPVLVLREEHTRLVSLQTSSIVNTAPILVGLDGSTFAEASLAPAIALAQALSLSGPARLHLIQVIRPMDESASSEELEAQRQRVSAAEKYLGALTEKVGQRQEPTKALPDIVITWSILQERDIADALIRAAQQGMGLEHRESDGYGVLALATHGRGGIQRWAVGSTTDRVIKGSNMPLLVVRPTEAQ